MGKIERLEDLLDEVYNAEDVIDGAYSTDEFKDLETVNEQYDFLLSTMNNFMAVIRTQIKHEEK